MSRSDNTKAQTPASPEPEAPTTAPESLPVPSEAPASDLRSPEAWGRELGYFVAANPNLPQSIDFWQPKHAVAAQLHGWNEHAHHYQDKPILLTREQYEAALDAGGKFPCVAPCREALSPVVAERFANFVPRQAQKTEKERRKELAAAKKEG